MGAIVSERNHPATYFLSIFFQGGDLILSYCNLTKNLRHQQPQPSTRNPKDPHGYRVLKGKLEDAQMRFYSSDKISNYKYNTIAGINHLYTSSSRINRSIYR